MRDQIAVAQNRLTAARSRLPRWWAPVTVALVVLAGCVALAAVDPVRRAELSPGCPFRNLTGLDCPGCGATRAVYALTQGDPARAIDHNVLVIAVLPVLAWAWIGWLATTLGRRASSPTLPPRVSLGLAGVVLVFWIGRNLPGLAWLGSTASWSVGT